MVIPAMQSNIFPPIHPSTNKHQSSRGQKNPPRHATPYKLKKTTKKNRHNPQHTVITSKTMDPRKTVPHHDVSYVNEEVTPSYE